MADTDIVQVIAEARIDARSLSEFVFKPASFMVTRRLAPSINTLEYYLNLITKTMNQAVINSGFVTIDSFELGATITQRNQALRHAVDGKLYRWAGNLPKVVSTNSTPTSSGGMGDNAWLEVSDVTLRQDLANPDKGAAMVGYSAGLESFFQARTVQDRLSETISVTDFGAKGDYNPTTGVGTDDTEALRQAISFASQTGGFAGISFPSGMKFLVSGTIEVSLNSSLRALSGNGCSIFQSQDVPVFRLTGTATTSGGPGPGNRIRFRDQGFFDLQGFKIYSISEDESIGVGVELDGCLSPVIRNNAFANIRTGVVFTGINRNVSIDSNSFMNMKDYGIYLAPGHNIHQIDVNDNKAFGFKKWFFNDNAELVNLVMVGNWAECGTQDQSVLEGIIDIVNTTTIFEAVITGNSFQDHLSSTGPLIKIGRNTNSGDNMGLQFSGNIISNSPDGIDAVVIHNMRNVQISGNNFFTIGGMCVRLQDNGVASGRGQLKITDNIAHLCGGLVGYSTLSDAGGSAGQLIIKDNSLKLSQNSSGEGIIVDYRGGGAFGIIFDISGNSIDSLWSAHQSLTEYAISVYSSKSIRIMRVADNNIVYGSDSSFFGGIKIEFSGGVARGQIINNYVFGHGSALAYSLPAPSEALGVAGNLSAA